MHKTAPPGMKWERRANTIEVTTNYDCEPVFLKPIVRDVLVAIRLGDDTRCSYCTRMGKHGTICDGCGAVV